MSEQTAVQNQPVVTIPVVTLPASKLPASKPNTLPASKPLSSKAAIIQAAKQQNAAAKAAKAAELKALKQQEKQLAKEEESLEAKPMSDSAYFAYEWKNSKASPKNTIEGAYGLKQGDDWLNAAYASIIIETFAGVFGSIIQEQKQAEQDAKNQARIEKAKETIAKLNPSTDSRFDASGKLWIDCNVPEELTDILNLIADNLKAVKDDKGKIQILPCVLKLKKAQKAYMLQCVSLGYVTESEQGYMLTDSALTLFQTDWKTVKANLALKL